MSSAGSIYFGKLVSILHDSEYEKKIIEPFEISVEKGVLTKAVMFKLNIFTPLFVK